MNNYINYLPTKYLRSESNIYYGWNSLSSLLHKKSSKKNLVAAIDGDYFTEWKIYKQKIKTALKKKKAIILDFSNCILNYNEINSYFEKHFSNQDRLFGKINKRDMNSILNKKKVSQYKKNFLKLYKLEPKKQFDFIICFGTGICSLDIKKYFDLCFYSNLTRSNSLNKKQWKKKQGKTQTIAPNVYYYFIFPLMENYQKKLFPIQTIILIIKKIMYLLLFQIIT